MTECVVSLVESSDHLWNPCNSVVWIRSSTFYPKDVGKLSNLVKSFVSYLSIFGFVFVHIVCDWLNIIPLISGDWHVADCCNSSEGLSKWYQSFSGLAWDRVSIPRASWSVRRRLSVDLEAALRLFVKSVCQSQNSILDYSSDQIWWSRSLQKLF